MANYLGEHSIAAADVFHVGNADLGCGYLRRLFIEGCRCKQAERPWLDSLGWLQNSTAIANECRGKWQALYVPNVRLSMKLFFTHVALDHLQVEKFRLVKFAILFSRRASVRFSRAAIRLAH